MRKIDTSELLIGRFTARRMSVLAERLEAISAEYLDAMAVQGPPADLVAAFAHPIPAMMICELLGVPRTDRATFTRHARAMTAPDGAPEDVGAAYAALQRYVHELVPAKRADPTDDVLSELTDTDLSDNEVAGLGTFLLTAGLDSTANQIALGIYLLLSHPDRLAALRADPGLVDQAAEELLRPVTIAHSTGRAATVDVEFGGQPVRAGETLTVVLQVANRDAARYPDPDTLDLSRSATGHATFGHGVHQRLGQRLARIEMLVALPALLARFPTLRLAVPAEEVPIRHDQNTSGVHQLQVTWDQDLHNRSLEKEND
ncbi:cytochrome P450 [Amycolatopsis sp. cmx-4-68]|uniref:cytochrome P450 n=1 Tax=Amycolatopsis sp. cmx-4-68 TaxID=2790938 RepID=UPI0039791C78